MYMNERKETFLEAFKASNSFVRVAVVLYFLSLLIIVFLFSVAGFFHKICYDNGINAPAYSAGYYVAVLTFVVSLVFLYYGWKKGRPKNKGIDKKTVVNSL
jgi:hypothetical protein